MLDNTLPFSERYGYQAPEAEITVRDDAPDVVRAAVDRIPRQLGVDRIAMREIVFDVLIRQSDPYNWSEYPNVDQEVKLLISQCPWYQVYDIAERVYATMRLRYDADAAGHFSTRINQVFRENGIGWEMRDGLIVVRDDVLTPTHTGAVELLEETGRTFASNELKEAIRGISRRPYPDITGAMDHAVAGLEAVARDVTGEPNRNLGALVQSLKLPSDIAEAVIKLWRYSSENARHGREGNAPDLTEAKLVVTVACAVSTFLVERHNSS